ncbi:Sugar or nucleoside kinase, ribokinase family [Caloramator quimbayensis]|uniref:Sugar or nucleoside kinase, ribokinase family n=1 Tax=Caloramator quimbayensis TaxID=1147123 RepID=A0A1T4XPY6_9CLOT|nr:carbohydrate kinase family protein [Caloramator quimbayensis]SKA91155.1 Sugar or nucleoside kinase, ribokinase family [Caloramator quimbayensis]
MSLVAAISPVTIDILYSGLPRMPKLGEEVCADMFDIQIGGGPPATLITLSKLGIDTKLGTFLSSDNTGRMAEILLEQKGVNYTNLYRGDERAVNVTSVASFPQDRYFLSYFSKVDSKILSDDEVYSFLKGAKVVIGIESHIEVMKKLKEEGTTIVYDVGWSDDLSIEKIKPVLKHVSVFTPNDKEARKIAGTDNVFEALEKIGEYAENVIITLGKNGSIAKSKDKVMYFPPVKGIKAVDTTGAGDNFLAGVIYGIYKGWTIEESVKMGNIVGAYSTTSLGCCSADITIEKAKQYLYGMTCVNIQNEKDIIRYLD